MKVKAIYPGSFDPITNGHLDILERSLSLYDEITFLVAASHTKKALFSVEERVEMITRETAPIAEKSGIIIEPRPFENLLMQFAEDVGASVIIRGLRAVSDFEYEFQMVGMNRALNAEIEMVFLMAEAQHQAIASKLVKEIARMGGDVSKFVSPEVKTALVNRFQ